MLSIQIFPALVRMVCICARRCGIGLTDGTVGGRNRPQKVISKKKH